MKKINLLLLAFIAIGNFTSAQVGIGTTNPATSAILDLNASDKGLLLNQVTLSDVSVPVDGMLVYDKDNQCVKAHQAGVWSGCIDSGTITGLECTNAVFSPSVLTEGTAYSGTMTVPYTGGNGAFYPASSAISSTGVTGLTATLETGVLNTGSGTLTYTVTGTPNSSGTAVFPISFGGQSCSVSIFINQPNVIPSDISFTYGQKYFIVSVKDSDYLPYVAPSSAATLDTNIATDGTTDSPAFDVQGTLTTTGINVLIPYVTKNNVSVALPAFSQTVIVPASYTEDGISRNVTLSYPAQTVSGAGTITATMVAVGGPLNLKKLDLQTGVGNDNLGWVTAQFSIGNQTIELRDIAGIPDRNINDASHRFLYAPVQSPTGSYWLNNNLGADYSNMNTSANPNQQATSAADYKAYGSLFQWGRPSDGHELITWATATTGYVSLTTTTQSTTDIPTNALYISNATIWRNPTNLNLWKGVNGLNNPCPFGYRLPTESNYTDEINADVFTSVPTAYASVMKFSASGRRVGNANVTAGNELQGSALSGQSTAPASQSGYYWSTDITSTGAPQILYIQPSTTNVVTSQPTSFGGAVRCIQN